MSNKKTDVMDLTVFSEDEFVSILDLADDVKKNPEKYGDIMKNKTLMMIFEKPSLRTRLSFEAGMTQMGGHSIFYDLSNSPMGKKESISDTAKAASRFVNIIMASSSKKILRPNLLMLYWKSKNVILRRKYLLQPPSALK